MQIMIKIAPSILNANFAHLQADIDKIKNADILHVDIMDGHFVPNLSMGSAHVSAIKTKLPIESHLMVSDPTKYVGSFIKAGSKRVIAHAESSNLDNFIKIAKENNCDVGVAINPNISLSKLKPYIKNADFFLLMTVYAGFGGQSFIESVLPKIKKLRDLTDKDIEVDGGINLDTAKLAIRAGANILVAGSYLFKSQNPKLALDNLRSISKKELQLVVKDCL